MSEVDPKQVNGDVAPAEPTKEVPADGPVKKDVSETNKDVNENVEEKSGDSGQDSKAKPDKKFLQKPGVRLGPLLEKDIIPSQEEVKTYQDALAQLKEVLSSQTALKANRIFEVGRACSKCFKINNMPVNFYIFVTSAILHASWQNMLC